MKKALFKLLMFLLLFCLTDGLAGRLFAYMQSQALSYSPEYIAHHANEDVIIFGSSKGGSNYNMELLNESTGMPCLNCADTGNGIIQMYGRYKLLTNRYTPKVIVYDVKPQFDLYKNDNKKYTMRSHFMMKSVLTLSFGVQTILKDIKCILHCIETTSNSWRSLRNMLHILHSIEAMAILADRKCRLYPRKQSPNL